MKGVFDLYNDYRMYQCKYCLDRYIANDNYYRREARFEDYGPDPYVLNIEKATKENDYFRTTLWTGENLQLTLMSIDVGEDIGLEVHDYLDQFIRIEDGEGIIKMGYRENDLYFQKRVKDDYAFIIPAGTWHNLVNTGSKPLKLYSIYAPPQHPPGTIHKSKEDAEHYSF